MEAKAAENVKLKAEMEVLQEAKLLKANTKREEEEKFKFKKMKVRIRIPVCSNINT